MASEKKKRKPGPMSRILALLWSISKFQTAITLIAGGLIAAISLVVYFTVYLSIDAVLQEDSGSKFDDFVLFGSVIIAAILGRYLMIGISFTLSHRLAFTAQIKMREQLLSKIANVPMDYFTYKNPQDLRNIIIDDVESLEDGMAHLTPKLASAIVGSLTILIALFVMDWRLALATLAPIILGMTIMSAMMSRAGDTVNQYRKLQQNMASQSYDLVKGMPTVRVYDTAGPISDRLEGMFAHIREMASEWMNRMSLPTALYQVFAASTLLFVLPVAYILFLHGMATVSTFVFFAIFGLLFTQFLNTFYDLSYRANQQIAVFRRIDELLNEPEISYSGGATQIQDHGVSFQDVTFSYGEKRAVENITLDIKPGERVALVGASGGGKSTIAKLAARFMDPDSGTISIGGVDLKDLSAQTLAQSLSCVFQESFVFADTIEANIRLGRQDASQDDIIAAAKAANAHDFISNFPEGYQTKLGEGVRLSGGEAQRLALARAFLRDAPILILDEATTHADAENEVQLQDAVARLGQGKTMLVIAHRLSTITDMDRIIIMGDGHILAEGRHEELLKSSGLYQEMWDKFRNTRLFQYSTDLQLDTPKTVEDVA